MGFVVGVKVIQRGGNPRSLGVVILSVKQGKRQPTYGCWGWIAIGLVSAFIAPSFPQLAEFYVGFKSTQ